MNDALIMLQKLEYTNTCRIHVYVRMLRGCLTVLAAIHVCHNACASFLVAYHMHIMFM